MRPVHGPSPVAPAVPDAELTRRIEQAIEGFRGEVGVYVRHLPTGREATVRADETFPTASLVKLPSLIVAFREIQEGRLGFRDELPFDPAVRYPEESLPGNPVAGDRWSAGMLLMLSITTSDNTAALWVQELAGGGAAVNSWLEENGFEATRVNSRTPGREADREQWGWGQTTPREMAELLIRIRQEELLSPGVSQELYRFLTRIYWTGEALSVIPPWVQSASKQGAVNRSRSEVVLVNAPSGDYAFTVITRNQEDESWEADNEGFVLLRTLSALFWEYFEPGSPWSPHPDARVFKP